MINPYENLANAIIEQAADDYRKALSVLKRSPYSASAKSHVEETERFFHSGWYEALTDIDGEYLIRLLKKEVNES